MKLIHSLVDKNNEIKFMMPLSPTAVSLRWHRAVEQEGDCSSAPGVPL